MKRGMEMYQFFLYQHDWKEPFNPNVMNFCMNAMKAPIEISELEVKGDCYDYCIHTAGLEQHTVQEISDAWNTLKRTQWVLERVDTNDILHLKNDEEIDYFIDLYQSRMN